MPHRYTSQLHCACRFYPTDWKTLRLRAKGNFVPTRTLVSCYILDMNDDGELKDVLDTDGTATYVRNGVSVRTCT